MANSHKLVAAADAHAPATHASTHVSGGTDAVKIDDLAAGDDNTDLNASTTKHGLLLKLDNASTNFLNGQGAWAVPAGSGGAVATDTIWDAAGDLVQGTGANTAAKLTLGAAGTVVRSTGSANAYAFPPGYEFDYVASTSTVSITNTTEGAADTVVASNSVAYDGSTIVMIEFFCPDVRYDANAAGDSLIVVLLDGATVLGRIHTWIAATAVNESDSVYAKVRLTPTAASHVFTVKAFRSAATSCSLSGATGGTGNDVAMYIRVTKA